jgi:hypothetical protein
MYGISTPQASDMAASIHHRTCATGTMPFPNRAMPKARQPLMIVARPIGMVPMNIDTVLCPKMRRASCPNITQRAP